MLNSLKKCLISLQKSAKTHVINKLNILQNLSKKSEPKRKFVGFDGLKSSYGSMELNRQLELVFKFIDVNGDGKISPNELSEFLMCLANDKSKVAEEAQGMLKHLDSDGDGFVDLNEYMDVVMKDKDDNDHDHGVNHNDHGHNQVVNNDGLEDDLMDVFLVFDSDKNGLISGKELQKVLKRLGFANCSVKECNLMFKGVDKDGDGFVNFDEFKLMMMGYVS